MSQTRANFLMLIATFIWGTAFVSQTTGMGSIGPFTFSFSRFFFATLTVLPLALYFERNNLSVEFYDLSQITSEDEVVFWEWDFGDGNISFDSNPMHVYEEYGSYNVSLVVMSEHGLYSESHIEALNVLNLLGDFNEDSSIDVIDVVILVDFILLNENLNSNFHLYDINIDSQVDVLDIISLIQIIID